MEPNEIILLIEITNNAPVELSELTRSLTSIGSQYYKYTTEHGYPEANKATKLYVNEIRTGSIILSLVEDMFKHGIIPFTSDVSNIVGFAAKLKTVIEYFKFGKGEKPKMSSSDLKDISQIIDPIAKDGSSQLNITAKDNTQVYVTMNVNSIEANAIQNKVSHEIEEGKKSAAGEVHERVLLYFDQAKRDIAAEKGNKGIIDQISSKALNVSFENDAIKHSILHSAENPFLYAYEVDVEIQTVRGAPAVYKVTQLHQSFLMDD